MSTGLDLNDRKLEVLRSAKAKQYAEKRAARVEAHLQRLEMLQTKKKQQVEVYDVDFSE